MIETQPFIKYPPPPVSILCLVLPVSTVPAGLCSNQMSALEDLDRRWYLGFITGFFIVQIKKNINILWTKQIERKLCLE